MCRVSGVAYVVNPGTLSSTQVFEPLSVGAKAQLVAALPILGMAGRCEALSGSEGCEENEGEQGQGNRLGHTDSEHAVRLGR
jgi:hypothetical protein